MRKTISNFFSSLVLICCSALTGNAYAEIIDDIVLKTDANGEVDAVVTFTLPIHYLRHFPEQKSSYLEVYFNVLDSVSRDQWVDYESHRSPPSNIIVGFTISTRDIHLGPSIVVKFERPVEYFVSPGKDGRSISIHIKPEPGKATALFVAPPTVGLVPPVLPPTISAKPALPIPVIALPAIVSKPVVEAQVGSAKQAESATQGQATLTDSRTPVPQAQVVKDGLPAFPLIEKNAYKIDKNSAPENLSLADQIGLANNQASVLMEKGRDALLAGEMFSAIEAFNNTLKLPSNKYTQDAQVWIGIAREKTGQLSKAKLEFDLYLKLYPDGALAPWVKQRLAKLNLIQPTPIQGIAAKAMPVKKQPSAFQTSEYGSLSMYYFHGASQTDTMTNMGGVQVPSSFSATDQSSLMTNVISTLRSYNNEYDNRLVFQDVYLKDYLHEGQSRNRLNAAYFEIKNRQENYSARIGRQSAFGGGVLGRFDGVTAGYGLSQNWRANVVQGRLADLSVGAQPVFVGGSVDFGVRDPVGGSLYLINQTVEGILDRKAVGGNVRYFEPAMTALAMLDYDLQFNKMNFVTLQGTLNGESGTDFNFLVDSRRSPILSIRNAVNGTTSSINTLLENGWTQEDLILLAEQRTAISNMAQFGITNHIMEKWQLGTDIMVSNTSGLEETGTLLPDGTIGVEGYVPASASTGNTWTFSERLMVNDFISHHDVTMLSLSMTKGSLMSGQTLLLHNHSFLSDQWVLDTTTRLYWQTDNIGGKQTIISPVIKVGYQVKTSLTLEAEVGLEATQSTPSSFQRSQTRRNYFSCGFRWNY